MLGSPFYRRDLQRQINIPDTHADWFQKVTVEQLHKDEVLSQVKLTCCLQDSVILMLQG